MAASAPHGSTVSRGLAWIGAASSLVGVLDIVATLVILRTWVPADQYGIATEAVWLFPILDQISDLGLSAAVIHDDDPRPDSTSTVFWLNLGIALALFGVIATAAPTLADHLYGHRVVGWLLVAYGTKLIWQAFYVIPWALMKRELRFKELSVIRVVANLAEFGSKIGAAAAGFGIWCFVIGPLCRVVIAGVLCQLRHPWRPRLVLRLGQARHHVVFGAKAAASQILFQLYTNVDYPIVASVFGDAALGLYRLAYEIVLEPVRIISAVVVDIAFPAFSRLRRQPDRLLAQFVSFTRLNLVTVMTYAAVVFVTADDLIDTLFPGYGGATAATRILCGVAVLRSVSFVIPPLLDGSGHPGRTVAYTLTAAIALPLSFYTFARGLGGVLGFEAVAVAWAVAYPIAFAVLVALAITTLDVTPGRFAREVIGVPACAVVAAAVGLAPRLALAGAPPAVRLVATGGVIVGVLAILLARTQGITIGGALRSMRAPAPAEPGAPTDATAPPASAPPPRDAPP